MNSVSDFTSNLKNHLKKCLSRDQFLLSKRLRQKNLKPEELASIKKQIEKSKQQLELRQKQKPHCPLNKELPIYEKVEELTFLLKKHQVIIVCGQTGSGKTTQLPQICLNAGRGLQGKIAHTQPRRLAARTVSQRIAEELKEPLGKNVGYKIRFQDKSNPQGFIKLVTDGVLLNEIHHDRYLLQYDTIIIDEAHERSLNIDFLLGYLKNVLSKRPDLKLIVTSATIDPESFAKQFGNAPILHVEGRTYPIETLYRPPHDEEGNEHEDLATAIEECFTLGNGDILVFLPTEKSIHEAKKFLTKVFHRQHGLEILPLFSRQSNAEQNHIFHPGSKRRIVLATNVAETSITVPRIDFVIDSGLARVSRYSVASKIQRLPIEKISQAAANQRAGRCGRLRPGTVIRLFEQYDFEQRDEFTSPEIQRTSLAAVLLQMAVLGLGNIERFPFIDRPENRQVNDGFRILDEIGALDKKHRLTKTGKQIAQFPIDPQLGRMILEGAKLGCLNEILIITSVLTLVDPRERPQNQQKNADLAHKQFEHKKSDFLSYLNLWNEAQTVKNNKSQNQYKKWCKTNFISWLRMREWFDLHQQLTNACKQLKLTFNNKKADYLSIHQSLISGIATHIAIKGEKNEYLATRNRKINLFPGSALFKKTPKNILFLEIAQTQRVYARTCAEIELEWVIDYVDHLVKRSYNAPYWQRRRGHVFASENTTLYGLLLSSGKKRNFGSIDPVVSHELFIRHALVRGEWRSKSAFLIQNLSLIKQIEEDEIKTRRKDLLINEEQIEAFYQPLIPTSVHNGPAFEQWTKKLDKQQTQALTLSEEQLLQSRLPEQFDQLYPEKFIVSNNQLPLKYFFNPGNERDGVVLTVPEKLIAQIPEHACHWLVPGFIEEKCIALLKGLEKSKRKQMVPIPNFVKGFLKSQPDWTSSLFRQLSLFIKQEKNIQVSEKELEETRLDNFYLMGFQIIDDNNKEIGFDKNLNQLRLQFQQKAIVDSNKQKQSIKHINKWDFGDLLPFNEEQNNGVKVRAYPSLHLSDDGKLSIKTFYDAKLAIEEQSNALIKLTRLEIKDEIKYLLRNLPEIKTTCLQLSNVQKCESIKNDIIDHEIKFSFFNGVIPFRQEEFEHTLKENQTTFRQNTNKLCQEIGQFLSLRHAIMGKIKNNPPMGWTEAIEDIIDQDQHLVFDGFLKEVEQQQLENYYRYYQAIKKRLDTLSHNPEKDRQRRVEITPLWAQLKNYLNNSALNQEQKENAQKARWLMEELRISLFAQQIGTKEKVSIKRIEKLIEK